MQVLKLKTDAAERALIEALQSLQGDIRLELQARPDETVRTTGMVRTPTGYVTVDDISRVLEACQPMGLTAGARFMCTADAPRFTVDDAIEIDGWPLGYPSRMLCATVTWLKTLPAVVDLCLRHAPTFGLRLIECRISVLTTDGSQL